MISKKALRLALALLSVLLLGSLAVPALADGPPPPPPQSHFFTGAVTFGGEQAPPGTTVSMHWDGSSKSTTVDADGNYGIYNTTGWFYLSEADGITPGQTITFKVNGVEAATRNFNPGATTVLNLNIDTPTSVITGVTGAVNCTLLAGVTVDLYEDATLVASTVSDGNGDYSLPVTATGNYEVKANKAGFREETQTINITSLGPQYELDFLAQTGLIPNSATVFYVLECINQWLYPEPPCELTVFRVLDVVNAWLFPV